jgi:putative transposase
MIDPQNVLGLDMDMQNLFTDNNGIRADYPRYYRQMQNQLALHQRRLSRCVYQSNNYYKQRSKVSRLQEKTANQRRDFLHKLSCQIANDYDAVCIENLNMKAMSQCLKLGKSVMDNGWGLFSSFLDYKLKDRGKPLVKVDKWYPSSKTCSICGRINQSLTLGDRLWTCDGCKTCHDRDVNAAINIKTEGLRLILA